ncbi:MAG: hypothetical protein IPF62_02990 [Bacteroidetes bacterium]|nr:hypothetical protein [Bacteroidota bacterium]
MYIKGFIAILFYFMMYQQVKAQSTADLTAKQSMQGKKEKDSILHLRLLKRDAQQQLYKPEFPFLILMMIKSITPFLYQALNISIRLLLFFRNKKENQYSIQTTPLVRQKNPD